MSEEETIRGGGMAALPTSPYLSPCSDGASNALLATPEQMDCSRTNDFVENDDVKSNNSTQSVISPNSNNEYSVSVTDLDRLQRKRREDIERKKIKQNEDLFKLALEENAYGYLPPKRRRPRFTAEDEDLSSQAVQYLRLKPRSLLMKKYQLNESPVAILPSQKQVTPTRILCDHLPSPHSNKFVLMFPKNPSEEVALPEPDEEVEEGEEYCSDDHNDVGPEQTVLADELCGDVFQDKLNVMRNSSTFGEYISPYTPNQSSSVLLLPEYNSRLPPSERVKMFKRKSLKLKKKKVALQPKPRSDGSNDEACAFSRSSSSNSIESDSLGDQTVKVPSLLAATTHQIEGYDSQFSTENPFDLPRRALNLKPKQTLYQRHSSFIPSTTLTNREIPQNNYIEGSQDAHQQYVNLLEMESSPNNLLSSCSHQDTTIEKALGTTICLSSVCNQSFLSPSKMSDSNFRTPDGAKRGKLYLFDDRIKRNHYDISSNSGVGLFLPGLLGDESEDESDYLNSISSVALNVPLPSIKS